MWFTRIHSLYLKVCMSCAECAPSQIQHASVQSEAQGVLVRESLANTPTLLYTPLYKHAKQQLQAGLQGTRAPACLASTRCLSCSTLHNARRSDVPSGRALPPAALGDPMAAKMAHIVLCPHGSRSYVLQTLTVHSQGGMHRRGQFTGTSSPL
jgi:hypothetical protein